MYTYNAKVVRVIDGDTVIFNVDVGFRLWREDSFRLSGINAPEMRGESREAGIAARDFLMLHLPVGQDVVVTTYKQPDKYGRYLAVIQLPLEKLNVNDEMIKAGHAVVY